MRLNYSLSTNTTLGETVLISHLSVSLKWVCFFIKRDESLQFLFDFIGTLANTFPGAKLGSKTVKLT